MSMCMFAYVFRVCTRVYLICMHVCECQRARQETRDAANAVALADYLVKYGVHGLQGGGQVFAAATDTPTAAQDTCVHDLSGAQNVARSPRSLSLELTWMGIDRFD